MYDLIIIGANSSGISHAIKSAKAGVRSIRLITQRTEVVYPELIQDLDIDVSYKEKAESIKKNNDTSYEVTTNKQKYQTRCVIIAPSNNLIDFNFPEGISTSERVLLNQYPPEMENKDILIVGNDDFAVEASTKVIKQGANVVLALNNFNPNNISYASNQMICKLEQQRKLTVLYNSVPKRIELIDGYPMTFFDDRRTPDLEFDYVAYSSTVLNNKSYVEIEPGIENSDAIIFTGDLNPKEIENRLTKIFPEIKYDDKKLEKTNNLDGVKEQLRQQHYNATITYFEPTHSDLWVLRVSQDNGDVSHAPGQYASLGLGYFEDRIDDATDPALESKWDKLVRRSYSISSKIFDENNYLTNDTGTKELEFYIVLVPPIDGKIPGLTPRLALKKPGDRIYLGPKVAGRYTLAPVTNLDNTCLFLSTGTGEAPHNAMIVDLLRKGHNGQIVSLVSVRNTKDLGYLQKHRELEKRYPNYSYIALPTREKDIPKRYIQDLIRDRILESDYSINLDPENSHVFLCGNPSMIGLPVKDEESGNLVFDKDKTQGVIELLIERGFKLDERKNLGNIHVEEYW